MGKTSNRFPFTKDAIARIKPDEKRVTYHDSKIPNLSICVTPSGTKSFYLVRRVKGRPQRVCLGRYPQMTIERARACATEEHDFINKGGDPNRRKDEERAKGITLKQVFDAYLDEYAKHEKRTWEDDQRQFEKYLKSWHGRSLIDLDDSDINAWRRRIGKEHGRYQANRALSLLSALFVFARKSLKWKHPNPCEDVERFKEKDRDRKLNDAELGRFFMAVAADPNETFRDFVLTALLTGQRRSNCESMAWGELDLESGEWTIPASKFKTGEAKRFPLIPEMVGLLRRRQAAKNGSPHVFASYGRNGHIVDMRKAWSDLLARAEIKDFRFHDLRRTFASAQQRIGANAFTTMLSLGQKHIDTTSVYSRGDLADVRRAVQAATASMLSIGGSEIAGLLTGEQAPKAG